MKTRIPRIFEGHTVYILASGPSLHQLDGKDWLRGRSCIAVNSSMYVGDYPQVLFFGDAKWYWWNKPAVDAYKGLKFTLNLCWKNRDKSIADQPDLIVLGKGKKKHGLETNEDQLCFNGSSGACALNLAYHMGACRIILLGFDMRTVGADRNYIHHPIRGSDKYKKMINMMKPLAEGLEVAGVEVLNATKESALPWFKTIALKTALRSFPK